MIVTAGSVTSITGKQLHYLMEKTNSKPVCVNPEQSIHSNKNLGKKK